MSQAISLMKQLYTMSYEDISRDAIVQVLGLVECDLKQCLEDIASLTTTVNKYKLPECIPQHVMNGIDQVIKDFQLQVVHERSLCEQGYRKRPWNTDTVKQWMRDGPILFSNLDRFRIFVDYYTALKAVAQNRDVFDRWPEVVEGLLLSYFEPKRKLARGDM